MKDVEIPYTTDELIGMLVMLVGLMCLLIAAYCWITRQRDDEESDNASLR